MKKIKEIALGIILFGSRARGEAGPWSDVDLYVVVPDGSVAPGIYRNGEEELVVRWESDFEMEFRNALPLALEISRDGKVLKARKDFLEKFNRLRKKVLSKAVYLKKGVWKWI